MRAVVLAVVLATSAWAEKPAPVVEPPKIIEKSDPEYTPEARAAGIEGRVLLSGVIDVNGRVTDIILVRPLSHGLGDKAIECARKWLFIPAKRDGVPFAAKANLEVNFRLPPK